MKDFIFESDLDAKMKVLDVDKKLFTRQRLMYAFIFMFVSIILAGVLFFAFKKTGLMIGIPIILMGAFGGWKYMYMVLNKQVKAQEIQLGLMFPDFLTTFISLLNSQSSGNVINAIESTIPYVKNPLRGHIVTLVRDVYADSSLESVWNSFNKFADAIEDKEAEQIMALVSDMYISGINRDALLELEGRINEMKQSQVQAYAKRKNNKVKNRAGLPSLGLSTLFIFGWAGTVAYHYLMVGLGGSGLF